MEKKTAHCLVLAYPSQGHINPMLQFSKVLQHEGVKVTLASTFYYFNNTLQKLPNSNNISLETISDGFDNVDQFSTLDKADWIFCNSLYELDTEVADWTMSIWPKFRTIGPSIPSKFLDNRIKDDEDYGATQFTSVECIEWLNDKPKGKLKVPLVEHENISLPLLPKLQLGDMPSFFNFEKEENPPVLDMLVRQLSNINEADWILCNSFYELEKELIDWTMKIWSKFRTIGPSIPSKFSDKRLKDDEDYGLTQFKSSEESIMKWLDNKPKGSVVYVSFGSLVTLKEEQIEEVACGLRDSGCNFLWVVRASEESKLPKDFEKNRSEKGLVVTWCSQLKVLAHEAIGCFVTHCGWNSTLEALSLGVPMIAMPQWSDQTTNAKFIADVWKMGIRAPIDDEKQIVRRDVLKNCILEIMDSSEKGKEIKNNVMQWNDLIMRAVNEGGSSHKNIIEFVNSLLHLQGTGIETN